MGRGRKRPLRFPGLLADDDEEQVPRAARRSRYGVEADDDGSASRGAGTTALGFGASGLTTRCGGGALDRLVPGLR
jgi:hypothetical protein